MKCLYKMDNNHPRRYDELENSFYQIHHVIIVVDLTTLNCSSILIICDFQILMFNSIDKRRLA